MKSYNIYTFIATITRNIIDVYSIIYLYKIGFTINTIIEIYATTHFLGCFISNMSLTIGNKIGYKYILMFSSITTPITFVAINNRVNIYLIALCLSLSIYTYHPIRHYYGILLLHRKKEVGYNLIITYIAILLSSYIAINEVKTNYLVIITILGIIPAFLLKNPHTKKVFTKINKNKLSFFLFDQFRLIFLLLEPLYLYTIYNNISYVGLFNIILTLSAIVFIYGLMNKVNLYQNYKYLNIIFALTLLLKLNINNHNILLIIAFLEGIGIKINELISTLNFYDINKPSLTYITECEKFFCLVKSAILSTIYFISADLKISLYILLIGIFILSFQYKKDTT